jgi:hypothetical protein
VELGWSFKVVVGRGAWDVVDGRAGRGRGGHGRLKLFGGGLVEGRAGNESERRARSFEVVMGEGWLRAGQGEWKWRGGSIGSCCEHALSPPPPSGETRTHAPLPRTIIRSALVRLSLYVNCWRAR